MENELVTIRQNLIGRPQKKPKRDHTRPTGFGLLRVSKGQKARMVRILFDSGATGSFIDKQHTKRLRVRNTTQNILANWKWESFYLQEGQDTPDLT